MRCRSPKIRSAKRLNFMASSAQDGDIKPRLFPKVLVGAVMDVEILVVNDPHKPARHPTLHAEGIRLQESLTTLLPMFRSDVLPILCLCHCFRVPRLAKPNSRHRRWEREVRGLHLGGLNRGPFGGVVSLSLTVYHTTFYGCKEEIYRISLKGETVDSLLSLLPSVLSTI